MNLYDAAVQSCRYRAWALQGELPLIAHLVDHTKIVYRREGGRWLRLPECFQTAALVDQLQWQPLRPGALDDQFVAQVLGIVVERPRTLCGALRG